MDCIFCKIIRGDLPSFKIYEDSDVIAFLDIKPIKPGHTLVVPKKHTSSFLETPDETLTILGPKIKKIAQGVIQATGVDACNISFNSGRAAGQIVFHLHAHIIPRGSNDGLVSWPDGEYKEGEGETLADKIRKQITNN